PEPPLRCPLRRSHASRLSRDDHRGADWGPVVELRQHAYRDVDAAVAAEARVLGARAEGRALLRRPVVQEVATAPEEHHVLDLGRLVPAGIPLLAGRVGL